MAQGTVKLPLYVQNLFDALAARMPDAEITLERRRKDRYTIVVVWKRFDRMRHPERQQLVWDIASKVITDSDILKVGMILTIAPKELATAD